MKYKSYDAKEGFTIAAGETMSHFKCTSKFKGRSNVVIIKMHCKYLF